MKLSYLVLGAALLGCAGSTEEIKFPEDEIIIIDPAGPSEQYGETLHKTAVLDNEYIIKMKCRRSIYTGKTESNRTILITRHCLENTERCVDGRRGWFYAHRYIDKKGDNSVEQECTATGTTIVGGINTQKEWRCYQSNKNLEDILNRAERWIKDPEDIFW